MKRLLVLSFLLSAGICSASVPFSSFVAGFIAGYRALHIPDIEYDHKLYFSAIPALDQLRDQDSFFTVEGKQLAGYDRTALNSAEKINYDHIQYEIAFNQQRIRLETEWVNAGRRVPQGGLHDLHDISDWYKLFVQRYTTIALGPEEVFAMGEREVARVKKEIATLQKELGFADETSFYKHLNSEAFYITDKQQVIDAFAETDRRVRAHLVSFIGTPDVPLVYAMEWPGATAFTPPGMYLNHEVNSYGKDVFQFNFYGQHYNKRAIEWLYMHEAIPGHHLQFSLTHASGGLQDLFFYPGNFEGWACYVEYFGKEAGLYSDAYMYLGKWEWDLVRSARLVLDAGIHYYGWSREKALAYWEETIPNQEAIAEREVTRVTNWPGQALSYKVGADRIFQIQEHWQQQHPGVALSQFRKDFLGFGRLPLTVIEKNIV